MSDPVIHLDHLHFHYGNQLVLEDICLDIQREEFLGIVGPNGSGKTTLLKLILGLLTPSSGQIQVLGQNPVQARMRIGYVPQFATFEKSFPIRVRDTVLQGRLGKTSTVLGYRAHDREHARAAMQETEILDLAHRPISALSGGQLQRVMIARALASDPEILILDEPTANIDPRVEEGVFDLLKRLNERVTVLLVSHDIGFISRYINRVVCLNKTLVCHKTSEIDGETIRRLYGSPMQMVHHHTIRKEN